MELNIERLDWDSDFFQQEVGRVQIDVLTEGLISQIQERKNEKVFDLIYLFIETIDSPQIESLGALGAKLVDEKVTYCKKISGPVENLIPTESYSGVVTHKLLELAIASGHKSRFFKDPRTSYRFVDLYRKWITNAVNRTVADEVLITKHKDEVSSFVTLKKEGPVGSIGLIAVHEGMRGMGIGKQLMAAANNWYVANNCTKAIVVTQKDNLQACALYEKAGYSLDRTQFIFHL